MKLPPDENEEDGDFNISEPDEWEEPEAGVEIPNDSSPFEEIDHELDPGKAKQRSKERIEQILENQRTHQKQKKQPTRQQEYETKPEPVADIPLEPEPGSDPEPDHTADQESGRDSLDELDRRIDLVKESGDSTTTTTPAEPEETQDADQELVDQILEVHTEIAQANQHTGELEPTLDKLEELLRHHGITSIEPEAGDSLDPHRHRVIETVDSDSPSGTIVDLVRPGYENPDHVIEEALVRTAKKEE